MGGVWAVVKLALRFQKDFTDRYIIRNRELEGRVDELEAEQERQRAACMEEIAVLRAATRRCERRENQLIRALAMAGINLPTDYDG